MLLIGQEFCIFRQMKPVSYSSQHSIIHKSFCAILCLEETGNLASLYAVNDECFRCSQTLIANETTRCVSLWTPHRWTLYLYINTSENFVAKKSVLFGEQGHYTVIGQYDPTSGDYSITIDETAEPVNSNLPFYLLIAVLAMVAILSYLLPFLVERFWTRKPYLSLSHLSAGLLEDKLSRLVAEEGQSYGILLSPEGVAEHPPDADGGVSSSVRSNKGAKTSKPGRLSSLDTFRGLSLTLMIFVNYGGGGYWYLDHAPWNGLTVADLLFPWFMWIMGVSMALSFSHLLRWEDEDEEEGGAGEQGRAAGLREIWLRVCRRALILFLIGMFLANGYEYTTWRVPGVLQYFAVSYFVTAAAVLLVFPHTRRALRRLSLSADLDGWERVPITGNSRTDGSCSSVWDSVKQLFWRCRVLTAYRYEWAIQLAILVVFLSVCLGVAAPGCPMVRYN